MFQHSESFFLKHFQGWIFPYLNGAKVISALANRSSMPMSRNCCAVSLVSMIFWTGCFVLRNRHILSKHFSTDSGINFVKIADIRSCSASSGKFISLTLDTESTTAAQRSKTALTSTLNASPCMESPSNKNFSLST